MHQKIFRREPSGVHVFIALLSCLTVLSLSPSATCFGQQSDNLDVKPSADSTDELEALQGVLKAQSDAWNEGNIDGFMATYWKSEKLTFSSGGTVTRGWQQTIDRYKQRYDTRKKMGTLTFDELEVTLLSENAALILGNWHLARGEDSLNGNFSLVLRKFDDGWKIIHDHTSEVETESDQ